MAKFITVKQIIEEANAESVRERGTRPFAEDDEGGEDDGLPQELPAPNVQYANASNANPTAPYQAWKPNRISVDAIRNWYPRKGGKHGCRLILKTGVAYPVADTFDEIVELVNSAVNV